MVKFGKRGNERANDVLSGGEESVSGRRKASRRGAVVLAVTLFLVAFALVAATFPFRSAFTVALAVVAGLALAGSVHIATNGSVLWCCASAGSTASPGRVCTSPSPWWIR
ncbi:MAG: hypothetical protein ACLR3C_16615 [Eggerthella lenta]